MPDKSLFVEAAAAVWALAQAYLIVVVKHARIEVCMQSLHGHVKA